MSQDAGPAPFAFLAAVEGYYHPVSSRQEDARKETHFRGRRSVSSRSSEEEVSREEPRPPGGSTDPDPPSLVQRNELGITTWRVHEVKKRGRCLPVTCLFAWRLIGFRDWERRKCWRGVAFAPRDMEVRIFAGFGTVSATLTQALSSGFD